MDDVREKHERHLEMVMRNEHAKILDYIESNISDIINAFKVILNFAENDEIKD
jgi:hypothetical protein